MIFFMPYRARSGIQQQPGIGTFREKGGVRALQVPAGEKIDRSGGGGDKGDVVKFRVG